MEFNKVFLAGNLTRDPELRMAGQSSVVTLGIASNRTFRRTGSQESEKETTFVDVDVWGRQADTCNQYLSKGSGVLIEGRLKLDQWQDKDGNNRNKLKVVAERVNFFPRSGSGAGGGNFDRGESFGNTGDSNQGSGGFPQGETFNDEVPF
ncbi:MAG: hypothetical protein CBC13_12200 [Planctomycetia bacterium TMED53]|nr:MAG: hypothetical protein CBC13_12200 [Planctomycetia bacterium TMED53]